MPAPIVPRLLVATPALGLLLLSSILRPHPPVFEWLTPPDADHFEPAAVQSAGGAAWICAVRFTTGGSAVRSDVGVLALDGDDRREVLAAEREVLPAEPSIALLDGGAFCAWERGPHGARELVGRALSLSGDGISAGPLETIARGRALSPQLARTGADALEVVFIDAEGALQRVRHARRSAGTWSEPADISLAGEDAFAPRCAAAPDGSLHVVFDVWNGESFDVVHLAVQAGRVVSRTLVAGGAEHQSNADVCVAPDGVAWIAWERAPSFGTGGPLRESRAIELVSLELAAGRADPEGAGRDSVPGSGRVSRTALGDELGSAHLPRIAWAGAGPLLLWRTPEVERVKLATGTTWRTVFARFDAEGKLRVQRIAGADGGPETCASFLVAGDRVDALLAGDGRPERPVLVDWNAPEEGPSRLARLSLQPSAAAPAGERVEPIPPSESTPALPAPPLLFGDLHRHTSRSRCLAALDGVPLDQIRYARGPGGLAFLSITDHAQHLSPASIWRAARDADRHDAPGRLAVLPGVEKMVAGSGHQNLVWLDGDALRSASASERDSAGLPAFGDARHLAIPHMTGSHGGEFLWRWLDPEVHRLVEVYQGLRGSYEGPRAPYRAGDIRRDLGTIQRALANGRMFGLIAASDHGSSAGAFAGILAERIDRRAVFEALSARRTVACTSPCRLEVRLGDLVGGESGAVPREAALEVSVAGGGPVACVEVLKNGGSFRALRGEGPLELYTLSCHVHEKILEPRLVASFEGARLVDAWARAPVGDSLAVIRSENRFELRGGRRRADAVFLLDFGTSEGAAEIAIRHGEIEELVRLADVPLGAVFPLLGLQPAADLRRVGPPLGEREVRASFEDPERRPGDVYHVRVTFASGQMAWSSPVQVTR